jgi:tetratricopeptide (TPR) repeat protein
MSLINQVLRDLQSRQVEPPVSGLQGQIRPVITGNSRFRPGLLLLAVVLPIALSLSLLPGAEQSVSLESFAHQPPLVSDDSPAAHNKEFSGVHLAGLRLVDAQDSSRLLLEFSQPLGLAVNVLIDDRQMTVLLPESVTPARQLSQPELEHALVNRLDLLQVDRLWQLQVHFSAAVRVEELILKADDLHGERLVFDIYPQVVEVEEAVAEIAAMPAAVTRKPERLKPNISKSLTKKTRIPTLTEQAEDFYRRGVEAAKGVRTQDSLKYWRRTLRLQPGHLQARKRLILALLKTNPGQANALFAESLILHDPLELRKWYARTLLPIVGAARAVDVLDDQKVSVTQDAEYRALQAALWQQSGDYSRSHQAYLELLREFPANGLYLFGLAVAIDQLSMRDGAISAYRRALQADLATDLQSYSRERIESLVTNSETVN